MRLLFVNQRLTYTSTSSYTLDLALALRRLGEEVQICTMGGDLRKVFSDLGIESYLVRFNPLSFWKLLDFLHDYQPDLIHIQNNRSARFGQKIARRLDVPYVLTVHRPPDDSSRISHWLLGGVIAANEVIRQRLVNNHGIQKQLIRVIHHGIDVNALSPEKERKDEGQPPDLIPVIGSIGRLSRIKGHHVFLKAARRVIELGVEAMFAIVGEGEEEWRLRRLVKEYGLEKKVTFSPHLPNRRELYRIFDIVAVPTLSGGIGLTALEAMAMAKPVIASAVGEILHLIQDGKTGLLVPEGDWEALAAKIVELIKSPDRGRSLGREARAYVVENFSLAPMIEATRQFYEEVHWRMRERGLAGGVPAGKG